MNEDGLEAILLICDWCANPDKVAAELQTASMKLHALKVRCTGSIDPAIVLEAFLRGADGVIIVGCEPGNCHFIEGDLQAERRVRMIKKLLALAGFQPERLELRWDSALDESGPVKAVGAFMELIQGLGASPLSPGRSDPSLHDRVSATKAVLEDFRMRALVSRELELTERGNIYGERVEQAEFDEVSDEALEAEFYRCWMYLLLKRGSRSVKDLAGELGVGEQAVLRNIVVLQQRGLIIPDRIVGKTPLYLAP